MMSNSLLLKIQNYLFILLGLSLPFSIAVTNILIGFISVCWIIDGNFHNKWIKIKSSKWMISVLLLVFLYFLSAAFFIDFTNTKWTLMRICILLFLPLLFSSNISQKTIRRFTFSFLIAMFISSLFAIAENYEFIHFNKNWTIAAFLKYTTHNVFLALSFVIAIFILVYSKVSYKVRIMLLFLLPFYLFSIFTEGGKAGQIVLLILVSLFFIFHFRKSLKLIGLSFFFIFIFSYLVFTNSEMVQNRFNYLINYVKDPENNKETSIGTRVCLIKNTWNLIKQKPIFGHGTGSFTDIFSSINDETNRIVSNKHKTPHNNYLFIGMELGLIGLLIFLSIFYFQIKEIMKMKFGLFRILFPIMFLIIMFADSYFFSINTEILYVVFSIIIFNYQYKPS